MSYCTHLVEEPKLARVWQTAHHGHTIGETGRCYTSEKRQPGFPTNALCRLLVGCNFSCPRKFQKNRTFSRFELFFLWEWIVSLVQSNIDMAEKVVSRMRRFENETEFQALRPIFLLDLLNIHAKGLKSRSSFWLGIVKKDTKALSMEIGALIVPY